MAFLFFSILFTSGIYLLFRLFSARDVQASVAIVINYGVAAICTYAFLIINSSLAYAHWAPRQYLFAIALGFMFIIVFNLMSSVTRQLGVAGGTIISRMSMVVPAAYSVIMLHEHLMWWGYAGIVLAILAIYFTVSPAVKREGKHKAGNSGYIIPILAFTGVGISDTFIKISQINYMSEAADENYIAIVFIAAFAGGLLHLLFRGKARQILKPLNLKWGVILGVINFCSLILFFKAIASPSLSGSQAFPINSVGIVAVSTAAAMLLFRERPQARQWIGLALALAAILLISFA